MAFKLKLKDPPADVTYPYVLLRAPLSEPPVMSEAVKGMVGLLIAMLFFMFGVAYVMVGVGATIWQIEGQPGSMSDFLLTLTTFTKPEGMLARHLGMGSLIVVAFALVTLLHQTRGRWLSSVQPGFRWRWAFICFLAGLVVIGAFAWASSGFTILPIKPQADFGVWLVVIILTVPIQAAAEEYFFRGYLLAALGSSARSKWLPIIASALLFAVFHGTQNWALFTERFGFGMVAGVLALYTGGLEASIAVHTVNNLYAYLVAGLTSSIAQVISTTELTWLTAIFDITGYALFALAALWFAQKLKLPNTTP
ncbi:MAG: CPBP family intramembrane metalloprotease [Propionibacteriaceae bacterium]|jgi:membrane protease YdiL (CAAX protease family)|nr:CPBP family intramembrane metalloprotease [Propionibacteriaceae bacterium]